ncbi:MAG: hypothetical protein ABWY52_00840 [Candidatus Limnocylindrales bacterium]
MFRIRRFGVIKTATVAAVMYVVIVLVIFIPILLITALVGITPAGSNGLGGVGPVVGVLILGLLAAFFYGVFGWVFTAIACLLYNLVASWVGGIEVQVEAVVPAIQPPATAPPTWGQPGG